MVAELGNIRMFSFIDDKIKFLSKFIIKYETKKYSEIGWIDIKINLSFGIHSYLEVYTNINIFIFKKRTKNTN